MAERCLLFSHHCDTARCSSCLLSCFPQHWRPDLFIRMRLVFRFRLLINKNGLHNIWLGLLKDVFGALISIEALFVENGVILSIWHKMRLFYSSSPQQKMKPC